MKWDVQYCLRDWHLQPFVERAAQYLFCSCNFICQKASINIVKKGLAKLWETRQVKVFLKCNFLSYWCSLSGFLTPYNQGTFATNIFPYTKPHKRQNISLQKKHFLDIFEFFLSQACKFDQSKNNSITKATKTFGLDEFLSLVGRNEKNISAQNCTFSDNFVLIAPLKKGIYLTKLNSFFNKQWYVSKTSRKQL